jgi:hypothetical protein
MDAGWITVAAAFGGASIGGTLSLVGTWIAQRKGLQAQWIVQDRLRRQDLYKEFIQEASKCYVEALQQEKPDISSPVVLYEKMSRMRVISSPEVLSAAENAFRKIIATLSQPAIILTSVNLAEIIESGTADVLQDFGEACRHEFTALRATQV